MLNRKYAFTAESILNYLLVLFAFILPLSEKKATVVLVLIICVWIIEGRWKEKFHLLKGIEPLKYYALFILFLGLSLFWSETLYGGFVKHYPNNAVISYGRMYIFGFMIIPVLLTSLRKQYIKWLISAFLTAMFISEISSWLVYLDMIHLPVGSPENPTPFMQHSLYSIFLAVTIFILLTEFTQVDNVYLKGLVILFILSAGVNLFLNGGRLGQLAFFVAIFVYIFMYFSFSWKSFFLALMAMMVIFTTAYTVSPVFHKRIDTALSSLHKITKGNYRSSWGNRAYAWLIAKDIIIEHPLTGAGIGASKQIFRDKLKNQKDGKLVYRFWHMHNQYIQTLMDAGIIALFLLGIFFFKLLQIPLPRSSYILLCTFVVIYLVGFIGEPLFWNFQPFLLFNIMVAIFLYQSIEWKKLKRGQSK